MSKIKSITPLPPADFTPELGNYKALKPFRYWCQKVLPLVYDNSLSYYELLCKVVDYLNKTMEDVDTLHGDVNNLHTAYEELQNYVNSYFSTLDVQEEINNKLDEMAKSGELDVIFNKKNYSSTSVGIVNAILNNFKSYYEHQNDLVYAHAYEASNAMDYKNGVEEWTVSGKTGKAINCSCLVNLLLLGVSYEYSMYNSYMGKQNGIGSAGYSYRILDDEITTSNYEEIYKSPAMAKRFRDKGQLIKVNSTFSNILPGDVLFFIRDDYEPSTADVLDSVTHCAICVGTNSSKLLDGSNDPRLFFVCEAGGTTTPVGIRGYNKASFNDNGFSLDYIYIGRPSYNVCANDNKYIYANINGYTGNIDVSSLDFYNNSIATIEIVFTQNTLNSHINLYADNYTMNFDSIPQTQTIPGLSGVERKVKFITLMKKANGYSDTSKINNLLVKSTDTSATIKSVTIHEGLGGIDTPLQYIYDTADNIEDFVTLFKNIYTGSRTPINVPFRVYLSTSGVIPSGIYIGNAIKSGTTIELFCVTDANEQYYLSITDNKLSVNNGITNVTADNIMSLPKGFVGSSTNYINGTSKNIIIRGLTCAISIAGNKITMYDDNGILNNWTAD